MPDNELENMGISKEDMETPEQREVRAARLAEFRKSAEPMLESVYTEGRMPFDMSRDAVVARVTERVFNAAEERELKADPDFLAAAAEVIEQVNQTEGNHFVIGKYPLDVLRHFLAESAGSDSGIDMVGIDWTRRKMEEDYLAATGKTLSQWAQEYNTSHPDQSGLAATSEVANLFNDDYDDHSLSSNHILSVLREYAGTAGASVITANEALKALSEKGFAVPLEWKEEYADIDDGKTLLEAIENINKDLQTAEIVQTLEATYADMSPEEIQANSISANDILGVASLEISVPDTWEECDEPTQKSVRAAMKELAAKLGGKMGASKGVPMIKFEGQK